MEDKLGIDTKDFLKAFKHFYGEHWLPKDFYRKKAMNDLLIEVNQLADYNQLNYFERLVYKLSNRHIKKVKHQSAFEADGYYYKKVLRKKVFVNFFYEDPGHANACQNITPISS